MSEFETKYNEIKSDFETKYNEQNKKIEELKSQIALKDQTVAGAYDEMRRQPAI